jgi:hypothetical protein|tara:strand:- start:643 stop:969 length:327 start_codon:yes stop_codon:yes gene_type:complete
MTRTNEKLAEKIAKETAEDTRPQWQIDREERELEYDNAAHFLKDEQIDTLKFVMKVIQDADFMLHESYELGTEEMKSIDRSEWRLRVAFPELYKHIHNERMGFDDFKD